MHTITKMTLVKLKFHGSRFCVGISLTPTKGIYVKQKIKHLFKINTVLKTKNMHCHGEILFICPFKQFGFSDKIIHSINKL